MPPCASTKGRLTAPLRTDASAPLSMAFLLVGPSADAQRADRAVVEQRRSASVQTEREMSASAKAASPTTGGDSKAPMKQAGANAAPRKTAAPLMTDIAGAPPPEIDSAHAAPSWTTAGSVANAAVAPRAASAMWPPEAQAAAVNAAAPSTTNGT